MTKFTSSSQKRLSSRFISLNQSSSNSTLASPLSYLTHASNKLVSYLQIRANRTLKELRFNTMFERQNSPSFYIAHNQMRVLHPIRCTSYLTTSQEPSNTPREAPSQHIMTDQLNPLHMLLRQKMEKQKEKQKKAKNLNLYNTCIPVHLTT